jgi:hypothetical protein
VSKLLEQLADALDAFHNAALGTASARAADGVTFDVVASIVEGFNAVAAELRNIAANEAVAEAFAPQPPSPQIELEIIEDYNDARRVLRCFWTEAINVNANKGVDYLVRREDTISATIEALTK